MIEKDELRKAYIISARIVSKFGKTYLPVFQRLNNEIQKLQTRADLMLLASQIENE